MRIFITDITECTAFIRCNPVCYRHLHICSNTFESCEAVAGKFFLLLSLMKTPSLYKSFTSDEKIRAKSGSESASEKIVPVFWAFFGSSKKSCHVYKFTGMSSYQNSQIIFVISVVKMARYVYANAEALKSSEATFLLEKTGREH